MLERLRLRAGCRAWDTLIAAILLQRDAGGDLPALLRELAAALEAADRLERDARTATAQARFTAWLVVGLPVAAAALAELAAPGFLAALVAAPLPAALTVCALLLQADRPRRHPPDRAGAERCSSIGRWNRCAAERLRLPASRALPPSGWLSSVTDVAAP